MCIPFLDIPVHSGWYLFTGFLHVEKARTYSNKCIVVQMMWEHKNVFSLVVQLVCYWAGGERNNQPSTGAA
jgi:hypothetical protein